MKIKKRWVGIGVGLLLAFTAFPFLINAEGQHKDGCQNEGDACTCKDSGYRGYCTYTPDQKTLFCRCE